MGQPYLQIISAPDWYAFREDDPDVPPLHLIGFGIDNVGQVEPLSWIDAKTGFGNPLRHGYTDLFSLGPLESMALEAESEGSNKTADQLYTAGKISLNTARLFNGLDPVEGGDTFWDPELYEGDGPLVEPEED